MAGGLEMIRFRVSIIFLSYLIFFSPACLPINYRSLKANPDKAIIFIVEELSGSLDSWNNVGTSISKIDGSPVGLFLNNNVAYLLPGKHEIEIMVSASLDIYLDVPVWRYSVKTRESDTYLKWDKITFKSWNDYRTHEVEVLPKQKYDLIVSINMLQDNGEFTICLKPHKEL